MLCDELVTEEGDVFRGTLGLVFVVLVRLWRATSTE
jgi:hypothetical protein